MIRRGVSELQSPKAPPIAKRDGRLSLPGRRWVSISVLLLSVAGLSLFVAGSIRVSPVLARVAARPVQDNTDYSKFLHSSGQHRSVDCNSCHRRQDNSIEPRFPGHAACQECHLTQFTTPGNPMCAICHSDVNSGHLKGFPSKFKESFNVKFDHAQHNTGSARPQSGCASCHGRPVNRGVAQSIPVGLSAHQECYTCHTAGSNIGSCGTCHAQARYSRTSTNGRAFRAYFSHAEHSSRQRLSCEQCHNLSPGAAQSRQVSSTRTEEHFTTSRAQNCATCHNGKRSFGETNFGECKRCHKAQTFRMPA
jgi:c(7)-type cytochrome triheme protein